MKKILSLTLLAGSTVLAVMIFVQKSPEQIIVRSAAANLQETQKDFSAEEVPELPNPTASPLIQEVGTGIAEEIITQNPEGPEIVDEESLITAPDPKKIAEQLIKERLSKSTAGIFLPDVDESKVKIVANSDKASIDNYLKNTEAIVRNNFSGVSINFENPEIEEFKKLADTYEKTVNEFYSLNVPAPMANFHRDKIKLYNQQKKIFTNIANINKDPLSDLISMRLIGRAYDDLTDLNKKIVEFAKKNNL